MSNAPIATDLAPHAQSGMDEILASIREIIAEEPLSYLHRRPAFDEVRPVLPQKPSMRTLAPPHATSAGARVRGDKPPVHKGGNDPLLDELLDTDSMRATAPAISPAAVPTDVAVAVVMPPHSEVKTAADALGALAAGLAATRPPRPLMQATVPVATQVVTTNTEGLNGLGAAFVAAPVEADPAVRDAAAETVAPVIAAASKPEASTAPDQWPADTTLAVIALPLAPAGPRSLEDTIATMLRPLLREWLDANLPRMVEKALREELGQRVTSKPVTVPEAAG